MDTLANPITHVSKDDPPFLIMHGDEDRLVPLRQSELLEAALEKTGVRTKLHVVKGGKHGGLGAEALRMVEEFFVARLKPAATAGETPAPAQ